MQKLIRDNFAKLCIAIPYFCLGLISLTWLKYGIDFPLFDDWRNYIDGTMGHVDLPYLFRHANDTLYPVGKVLDSLAFRLLDGNTVAYQFISMILVLGMLLYLQMRLLQISLKDRFYTACAFSFTLLMLQPNSYWAWANMAYHQAIPLVCILAALCLIVSPSWRARWRLPGLIVLAMIAGLTYISGAFGMLVLGAVLILAHFFIRPEENKALLQGGLALLLVSFVTAALQLWVIVGIQKGIHIPTNPFIWPTEGRFWLFLLAMFSKSLFFSTQNLWTAFCVTLLVMTGVTVLVFILLRRLMVKRPVPLDQARPIIIFLGLLAVILMYGAMVAAGRAGLGYASEAPLIDHFRFGFHRFHYFWMTLIWPWVMALILSTDRVPFRLTLGIPAALIAVIAVTGVLDPSDEFEDARNYRLKSMQCIAQAVREGKNMDCPMVHPGSLNHAVEKARNAGASFMRVIDETAK